MLYSDDFLIKRLVSKMSNSTQRFVVKNPQSKRLNRKTFFSNFESCCKHINRDSNLVKNYIDICFNVPSSVLKNGTLVIEKMYTQFEIEKVFEEYIKEYVLCPEEKCKSGNTEIIRDNKLTFLVCKVCHAKQSKKLCEVKF